MQCYICLKPAVTIGWGFAVCGEGLHHERVRLLGQPGIDEGRREKALRALDADEQRYRERDRQLDDDDRRPRK